MISTRFESEVHGCGWKTTHPGRMLSKGVELLTAALMD